MGFLDDIRKGVRATQKVMETVEKATATEVEQVAEGRREDRGEGFDWAKPEEYDPVPPLRLRLWGEYDGTEPGRGGFGFEFPDGRWLHPERLGIRRWKSVGVFYGTLAGGKFRLGELSEPSFLPGKPLQFVAEPDNPHSEHGRAIAIRDWAGDYQAGYVPTDLTQTVRKLAADTEVHVAVLSCRYHLEGRRVVRNFLDWVMFRPGRIEGLEDVPPCPPIAPPREPY